MNNVAIIRPERLPAQVSTAETRLAYERLSASPAWYTLANGSETRARELISTLAEHLPEALTECRARLAPAPLAEVNAKLSSLLTLCAGSGFSEDDRAEWLIAATDATKGIPSDILDVAFKVARGKADHPSKIIPAMMASFQGPWAARRAALGRVRKMMEMASPAAAQEADDRNRIDPSDVAEANRINRKFGLTLRYHPDGRAFQLAKGDVDPAEPANGEERRG